MSSHDIPTILVVDDEADVTDLFHIWLAESYDVHTAYDGDEALDVLDESIDLVLLDRRMPGLPGDTVLEEIRERGLDCRVVMVTAVKPDFDVIEMPFDDYLVKPVSKTDLYDVIEQVLRGAEYDEQLQGYFALASKKAVLEEEKDATELAEHEEYQQLIGELEAAREEADETRSELLDHEDFAGAFRDL
jgi:DNA-binding response OmpR family regulator